MGSINGGHNSLDFKFQPLVIYSMYLVLFFDVPANVLLVRLTNYSKWLINLCLWLSIFFSANELHLERFGDFVILGSPVITLASYLGFCY